uniref:Orexigenic neuropeptide QRFP n=1 Tax=Castor canadensis TaxID=51338 RepID=A0A8C0ZSG5_CASCN
MMRGPCSLPYLLLLPLGACFPLLDGRRPTDAMGGIGAGMSWTHMAEGHRPLFGWSLSQWPRAPKPQVAKELQASRREHTGSRLGRQDGTEATSFLPTDGKKTSGSLGNLAEELSGYSRKKGGFSFRFGRR